MSYILDALKKADQQRELGQVPGIDSAHEFRSLRRGKPWLWVLAAVLGFNAVALAVLFWPSQAPEITAQSSPPVVTAAPVPRPAPAKPVELEKFSPPALAAQPAAPPVSTGQEPVAKPLKPLKPLPVMTKNEAQPVPDSWDEAFGRVPAPQPPMPDPALAGNDHLPLWPQVPDHLFSRVSLNLRLDVHVYSRDPSERFVLMNLQKYYEGEKLQDGLLLDEITPEGVILSLNGERFRLSAQ